MTDPHTQSITGSSKLQSRRSFLQGMLGLVAAAWAGWVTQGILFPAPRATTGQVKLALSDLPVGGTKPITYEGKPALVMRTTEGVTALSLICTHLGCTVQWREAKQEFYCPCHDGYFDRDGGVIAGPPPMPLEALPVKVTGNEIVIGEA
jgi:cytochrome b6-f complex iron-sulfur subunit